MTVRRYDEYLTMQYPGFSATEEAGRSAVPVRKVMPQHMMGPPLALQHPECVFIVPGPSLLCHLCTSMAGWGQVAPCGKVQWILATPGQAAPHC